MADQNDKNTVKSAHAEREERILAFWKEKGIFEKSLNKESPKGTFTFYDGPPFATGTPHYGHILAGTIKDVIPRWKTMQGYRVPRRWGWDCHGLPVENLIEKELGLKSKKDIIDFGIEKFNAAARKSVMRYADEWRHIIPRLGRFVDMEDDYRTMDSTYTESVWWIFKTLYDKGLVYEDFKSMNFCPHCETTLSNFEVAQGYKDITDISAYVKFKVVAETAGKVMDGSVTAANEYFLAWTTTPWTLPGNVALAVNPELEYVKVKLMKSAEGAVVEGAKDGDVLILAKSKLSVLKDRKYEIVSTVKGSELVGMSYEPVFKYYSDNKNLKGIEKGWKVYPAEFVTAEDGTGIVHIAPAFGADDYDLLKKYGLPFVQHVATNGRFKDEVTDFAGKAVKPIDTAEDKNAHQSGDIEVIKWLAHSSFLFEKEKLVHSYPHCWRCETPLLNYAASSWFVRVTDLKDDLVKENNKVTWVPPEVGAARFGNWLEGARDWAVSRSRFWGAPIPVWKEQIPEKAGATHSTEKYHVIGSVDDLKKFSHARNTYYVMRHGEAESNEGRTLNSDQNKPVNLTEAGKENVKKAAATLKNIKFDWVVVSPFLRTQETADIVREQLGLKKEQIVIDERIHEMTFGDWEGKHEADFSKEYPWENRFERVPEGAESYADIKKRMGDFLYDIEKKYSGQTILVVTHATPAMMMMAAAQGLNRKQSVHLEKTHYVNTADVRQVEFSPLPHNAEYELDLHRPSIDTLDLKTDEGHKLVRVPDVFDCWFESGSMPYGKAHYPFDKKLNVEERSEENEGRGTDSECFEPNPGLLKKAHGYPADFIAEGLDQTRGWFYSMLVLGVALFGKSPYKKVIVNGLVLAEDGQKMSKRLKNYPDPMSIVDKYGADSLRFYLLSSPVVHGQDLCFSEKGVDEVTKKIVNRLLNVLSFYEMYAERGIEREGEDEGAKKVSEKSSGNILDCWIVARLNETIETVTAGLEAGELDRAVRPFFEFTDDLSTWYLRRSRDRFKGDDKEDATAALNTTRFVLNETSKILAPFMPFLAEEIYGKTKGSTESVHLESWPITGKVDEGLIKGMEMARYLASKGLECRTSAKINVRQPLDTFRINKYESHVLTKNSTGQRKKIPGKEIRLSKELIDLIKDELNVKRIELVDNIDDEVELDINLTPILKEEGDVRELLRKIQDMRKEKGLKMGDSATLVATADMKDLISRHEAEIMKATGLCGIEYGEKSEIK